MGGSGIGIGLEWATTGLRLEADSSRVYKNENYIKRTSEYYSKFVETLLIFSYKCWEMLIMIGLEEKKTALVCFWFMVPLSMA